MRICDFLCLYAWSLSYSHICLAGDTLKAGEKITGNKTTLVSEGKFFELGFFSPSGNLTYLGIWYYGSKAQTVVWVANRKDPIEGSEGVFEIAKDGNLMVSSPNRNYSFSDLDESSAENRSAMLLDTGNLMLKDNPSGFRLWESFKYPTDTFLPGMKMGQNLELISWKAGNDPTPGDYTFKLSTEGENYSISKYPGQLYWEGDRIGDEEISELLSNFTDMSHKPKTQLSLSGYKIRLLMNSTGRVQLLEKVNSSDKWWSIVEEEPNNICKIYNGCGNFSFCDPRNKEPCQCLPGFTLGPSQYSGHYGYNLSAKGCVRKSEPCGENITFINLRNVKVRNPDQKHDVRHEEECEILCRHNCSQYQAYSSQSTRNPNFTCLFWTNDLTTAVKEEPSPYSLDLFVPVHKSDIALTPRTCEACGITIVPYPLSTGPNCGDPTYSKFICDNNKGVASFLAKESSYIIIGINDTEKKFYINTANKSCQETDFSSPFHVDRQCSGEEELGVIWDLPPEPSCRQSIDCQGWDHSTCSVNATGIGKCLCDQNYRWNGSTLNCTPLAGTDEPGQPISRENSTSRLTLILVVVIICIIFLVCTIITSLYMWKKKMFHKQDTEGINRIQGRLYDSERQVKDLIDLGELEETNNEGIGVPYFDFESILEATDNFSDAKKLGRGGYGPVYKGKLQEGQEIAVKRLSSVSSQGLQEFKNEVILIAKLQHRNLVRLRGYCIKGEEKILLYEFMPNKSLDTFIFDPTKGVLLNWPLRFDIILGIARGLLYLHQDSRLRVIHRDLKTSNILLDEEMQPKISDFGLARIFGSKETEANTERVVGTYFGIVILETISGKRNTGFYQSKQTTSVISHVWRLWAEKKLLDLMDPSLQETENTDQFIRCAHISLLCVQDEPADRPTMSNVLTTLDSEILTLPEPRQPTFFMNRAFSRTTTSSKPEISLETDSIFREG